jgi:membrane protein insertase Oxa1/YidC/SpoIIIJ
MIVTIEYQNYSKASSTLSFIFLDLIRDGLEGLLNFTRGTNKKYSIMMAHIMIVMLTHFIVLCLNLSIALSLYVSLALLATIYEA